MFHDIYRSKGDSRRGKTYQTSIARMRLMHLICIVVTELIHDLPYPIMVIRSKGVPDQILEF
jgi:hypothetical protein